MDVLIVSVRLLLQVIFRALWDECLLLISCLQLNDNRFWPIMKQLVAILLYKILLHVFASPQSEFIKKVAIELWVLEICCSIIKPKKERCNYRLELAIESWCWCDPPPPIITNYKSTINTRHCQNTDLVCCSLLPAYWLQSAPPAQHWLGFTVREQLKSRTGKSDIATAGATTAFVTSLIIRLVRYGSFCFC